jgi:hypothetical protein
MDYGIFDYVIFHNMKCIVTNASVAKGKKITISPVGNGNSPAKYFTVYPEDVKQFKPKTNNGTQDGTHGR